MTHTVVYHKSNNHIADEFHCVPDKITEHIMKHTNTEEKKQDCFMFEFASGNSCWYAHSDYYYKFEGGFIAQEK